MKTAIYPGSFNPFHKGHLNVLTQAMCLFDNVTISTPHDSNPDLSLFQLWACNEYANYEKVGKTVHHRGFEGSLANHAKDINATAIIRGLRNSQDLEYEKSMLYWNQDLGLTIPTIYFITDRELVHISSSAIRTVKGLK